MLLLSHMVLPFFPASPLSIRELAVETSQEKRDIAFYLINYPDPLLAVHYTASMVTVQTPSGSSPSGLRNDIGHDAWSTCPL